MNTNDTLAMTQAIVNAKVVPESVTVADVLNGGMPQDILQELNKLGWFVVESHQIDKPACCDWDIVHNKTMGAKTTSAKKCSHHPDCDACIQGVDHE